MLPRLLTFLACVLPALPFTGASASPTRVDQQVRNALQLEHNVARGEKLYRQHCAQCHGTEALGSAAQVIPSLAGQRKAYLIKQLADFTELERQNADMHRVVARPGLNQPQVWADVAGYVSGLAPLKFPQTGDRSGIELGEAIFHEQCASCHEDDARGDDDGFVPSLRDQHYSYLVRQIRSIGAWHRLNIDPDFARFMDSLDVEELTAVADYLSSMRGETRDRARLNDDGTINE
jgi:cbb3-type cytochrome c oxidase subunit III